MYLFHIIYGIKTKWIISRYQRYSELDYLVRPDLSIRQALIYIFKFFCGVIAVLSGLGFILTSRYMLTCLSSLPKLDSLSNQRNHQDHESLLRKQSSQSAYETQSPTGPRSSMPKALKYLIQLCKGKNFAIFIAVSLLQGIGLF